MFKKIAMLGFLLYFGVVCYYNTSQCSVWEKIDENVEITLEELDKAKNELFSMDIDKNEFVEKCNMLKELCKNTKEKVLQYEKNTDKEVLEEIIEEDIKFLTQDLNYDITIDDVAKEIIEKRIDQLEDLKKKIKDNSYDEIAREYEDGRLDFVDTYKLKDHLLM